MRRIIQEASKLPSSLFKARHEFCDDVMLPDGTSLLNLVQTKEIVEQVRIREKLGIFDDFTKRLIKELAKRSTHEDTVR